MDPNEQAPTVILGGGPAGLTAAFELTKLRRPAVVFEKDDCVGGIARTVEYRGYRFDIGGHRFFTKVPEVEQVWHEILGDDMLVRPRLSRIFYDSHFFDYPLRPLNALAGLGPIEAVRVALSYLHVKLFGPREERSFEDWVTNRFGRRLFEIFFETYTEKVWGMPCNEIGAEWAAQRIKNLDLAKAVRHALLGERKNGGEVVTSLIERFRYPRLGPGMMWERCQDMLADKGVETHLSTSAVSLRHEGGRVRSVTLQSAGEAGERDVATDHCISSIPLRELILALDPLPPAPVCEAADSLRYRDFLSVGLVVDRDEVFPDNWIYIHSPDVKMGRIQNFKNWSPDMVADPAKTFLGLEYFVQEGDELWAASDEDLVELGTRECQALGLLDAADVEDGTVVRMPKAYPVYDAQYQAALATIQEYLDSIENLQVVGRNGLHRYNNQDHSMLTAIYAARNVAGASYDVWSVNVDDEYHEEVSEGAGATGERLVPQPVDPLSPESILRAAFARYDPVALGVAVGTVTGFGLFLATAVLLIDGSEPVGPTLSILANAFIGFDVSWPGAFLGLLEAGFGGFVLGYVLAKAINFALSTEEGAVRRRIELQRTLDPLEGGGE